MTAVVLGATGGIGSATVDALLSGGQQVRAVSRSGRTPNPQAAPVQADVTDRHALEQALRGATTVYHCAQPPYHRWTSQFPAMNRAVTNAAATVGARLVVADNLYAYGPQTAAMTEQTPPAATDKKGRLRAVMTGALLAEDASGRVEVAIGRVSDYYGPRGVDSALGTSVFGRAVAGKPVQWIGSIEQPHTCAYLPDIGAALVILGTTPAAAGRIWHLPAAPPVTGRQLVDQLSTELGHQVRIRPASPTLLRGLGLFAPMLRELSDIAYQWTDPWVSDDTAFRAELGPFTATPHPEAVSATVRWWQQGLSGASA